MALMVLFLIRNKIFRRSCAKDIHWNTRKGWPLTPLHFHHTLPRYVFPLWGFERTSLVEPTWDVECATARPSEILLTQDKNLAFLYICIDKLGVSYQYYFSYSNTLDYWRQSTLSDKFISHVLSRWHLLFISHHLCDRNR